MLAHLNGTTVLIFAFVLAGAWTVTRWALQLLVGGAWTGPRGLFSLGALYALLCALVVLGAWSLMDQITGVLVVVGAGSLMRGICGVLWLLLRSMGLRAHQPRLFP